MTPSPQTHRLRTSILKNYPITDIQISATFKRHNVYISPPSLWRCPVCQYLFIKHTPYLTISRAWTPKEWTSSDDRVRGGSSISNLTCSPSSLLAKFHGTLDIKTLGGAGFASQRTTGTDRTWDLSAYDGLELILGPGDGNTYTLTLKDEILPRRPDGRESSSISWEYDFRADERGSSFFVKWADLRATYRGRNVDDVRPLDLKGVKRFGIMIRRCVCSFGVCFGFC